MSAPTADMPSIRQPVTDLKGVGPALARCLARLNIYSIEQLLFHLPYHYQDRTQVSAIEQVRLGQTVVLEGSVSSAVIDQGRRRSLLCYLSDGSGRIALRFFHFSAHLQRQLCAGSLLRCYGEVRQGRTGLELYHPEYTLISELGQPVQQHLTPVYASTQGLTQLRLRQLIDQALGRVIAQPLPDYLPEHLAQPPLQQALLTLHRPPVQTACIDALVNRQHPAQRRLALEELVAHHLSLLRLKRLRQSTPGYALAPSRRLQSAVLQALPFTLTQAQQRVIATIRTDLAADQPMQRLVQGDVGSGKTLVALMAALQAVEAGYQVALMAPTEIVVEQHYQTIQALITPLHLTATLLLGKQTKTQRQQALQQIASGQTQIAIGTHALFQAQVAFQALALIIIDEQHRFGVEQRLALQAKGCQHGRQPHQLMLSATPIPRSLAMSIYADLDLSIMDERPPGRIPVHTSML